jgi:Fe-S oxidoreductase
MEEFLGTLLKENSSILPFTNNETTNIAVHVHCHAKASRGSELMAQALYSIPNSQVQILPSACCGMAGAYGMMKDTYPLSMEVGEHLKKMIEKLPQDTKTGCFGNQLPSANILFDRS